MCSVRWVRVDGAGIWKTFNAKTQRRKGTQRMLSSVVSLTSLQGICYRKETAATSNHRSEIGRMPYSDQYFGPLRKVFCFHLLAKSAGRQARQLLLCLAAKSIPILRSAAWAQCQ